MAAPTITPSDAQWAAVQKIVAWYKLRAIGRGPQVFYLAGYAGTGKSTIFRIALQELKRWGCKSHALATFTGKAASVLRKKGNPDAQTIHSLIYIPDDDEDAAPTPVVAANGVDLFLGQRAEQRVRDASDLRFQLNIMGPASEVDLIALDECSMVDADMAADVLSFGKPVLVMGDPGQLPPVRGEGYFQKLDPDVFLEEVHRQALDSPILQLATLAREGRPIPMGFDAAAGANGRAQVVKLTRRTEHMAYREATQLLCGVHRVRRHVTRAIRHIRGFGGTLPMAGEPLICGKNNRDLNLFNGLQGELLAEPDGYKRRAGDDMAMSDLVTLDVVMDDGRDPLKGILVDPWMFRWHFDDGVEQPRMQRGIEWFDFGYALTVHKAQGSEWDDVTVIDDSGSFREERHRWLYTACTRASERLTILRR